MTDYFGDPWNPSIAAQEQGPTPIGDLCLYCHETIEDGDQGVWVNDGADALHRECLVRMIAGSVGHQKGRCFCFGGEEEDPPGLTKREAAIEAARLAEGRCAECDGVHGEHREDCDGLADTVIVEEGD
jgi:hypothetical protein